MSAADVKEDVETVARHLPEAWCDTRRGQECLDTLRWLEDNAGAVAAANIMLVALKAISLAAQTSGGVAGRDENLVAAIDGAAAAIAKAEGRS